jgi:hypothetical protein
MACGRGGKESVDKRLNTGKNHPLAFGLSKRTMPVNLKKRLKENDDEKTS